MSLGPHGNIPTVLSREDYELNRARIEQARKVLNMYDAMNEDARHKYEDDLALKIAEGDKARRELERLRNNNAPLSIMAPPVTSSPQIVPISANVGHVQTTGIAEIPSHHVYGDQRLHAQTLNPTAARRHVQTDQRGSQTPVSLPHTFYNNSGTAQEPPPRRYSHYRPESFSPIANPTHRVEKSQRPAQSQAAHPVQPQQGPIPPAPTNVQYSSAAPQMRTTTQQQRQLQSIPSRAPQRAISAQQRTTSEKAHSHPIVAPPSNERAKSIQSSQRDSWTSTPDAGAEPAKTESAKRTVTDTSPLTSTTGQSQVTPAPTSQPHSSTLTHDNYKHFFNIIAGNYEFMANLRIMYPIWVSTMRPNSYVEIPNSRFYIARRPDQAMFLAIPNGNNWVFLDLPSLVGHGVGTVQPTIPSGGTQQPATQLPTTKQPATKQPTTQQPATQLSATKQLETRPQRATQQPATQHTAVPPTVSRPAASRADIEQTPVQLWGTISSVPQPQTPGGPRANYNQSPSDKTLRSPADANRKHLARDILRALGIKRPRPLDRPEAQAMESAAKRHEPDHTVHVAPAGQQGIQLTGSVTGVPAVDGAQSIQPNQSVVREKSTVNDAQEARGASQPIDSETQTAQSTEPLLNDISSSRVVDKAQQSQPVAAVASAGSLNSSQPTLIQPDTQIPTVGSLSAESSVASAAVLTVSSTDIDVQMDPSPTTEVSPEAGPPTESIVEISTEDGLTVVESIPMDVDESVVPLSYSVESPLAAANQTVNTQERSDDAINESYDLTTHEEIISPAVAEQWQASQEELEEGELVIQGVVVSAEEGEIVTVPQIRSDYLDAGEPPQTHTPTPHPKEDEGEKASRTPLFLPSPSASPQRGKSPSNSRASSAIPPPDTDYADEDMSGGIPEATKIIKRKWKFIRRRRRKQSFYILVPPPPLYLVKFKGQEARRQRKRLKSGALRSDVDYHKIQSNRSPSQDTADAATMIALRESTTRLTERRCKWNGCDVVMNSAQNLFNHLRQHCAQDHTKRHVLCYWSGCGDHVPNSRLDEHLGSHAFFPLLCPYKDCEESFRVAPSLMKHTDLKHKDGSLKVTPEPFAPTVKELPAIPKEVPAYMIESGPVRQESISSRRHMVLGPWVYNNIAGPIRVTKRYNAAKRKPTSYEYESLQDSSMKFSTNPSRPARIRDLDDLDSVEVSGMVSDGLVIWPPKKKRNTSVISTNSEAEKMKSNASKATLDTEELQDDFSGSRVEDHTVIKSDATYEATQVSKSTASTHQTSSEEDAVETMLTGM